MQNPTLNFCEYCESQNKVFCPKKKHEEFQEINSKFQPSKTFTCILKKKRQIYRMVCPVELSSLYLNASKPH